MIYVETITKDLTFVKLEQFIKTSLPSWKDREAINKTELSSPKTRVKEEMKKYKKETYCRPYLYYSSFLALAPS